MSNGSSGQDGYGPTPPADSLARVLVGYAIAYGAFEGTAQLALSVDLAWRQIAIAIAGIVATLGAEVLLFRRSPWQALRWLGLSRPSRWSMLVSAGVSLLLLAAYPVIARLTGAQFVLAANWPILALGIFLMNGVAEETIYRGYLFQHLRQGRTFRRAVLLGIVLHAAAHLPILAVAGVVVGLSAVLVAVLTFLPYAALFERGRNTVWAPALLHFSSDSIKLLIGAGALADPAVQMATLLWLAVIATVPYLLFAIPGRPRAAPAA